MPRFTLQHLTLLTAAARAVTGGIAYRRAASQLPHIIGYAAAAFMFGLVWLATSIFGLYQLLVTFAHLTAGEALLAVWAIFGIATLVFCYLLYRSLGKIKQQRALADASPLDIIDVAQSFIGGLLKK